MNINMYVINAILVLMVVRQIREHSLDLRSLAVPVLAWVQRRGRSDRPARSSRRDRCRARGQRRPREGPRPAVSTAA